MSGSATAYVPFSLNCRGLVSFISTSLEHRLACHRFLSCGSDVDAIEITFTLVHTFFSHIKQRNIKPIFYCNKRILETVINSIAIEQYCKQRIFYLTILKQDTSI